MLTDAELDALYETCGHWTQADIEAVLAQAKQANALRARVADLERWKLVAIPVIESARETATCSGYTSDCDAPVCEALRLFDAAALRGK